MEEDKIFSLLCQFRSEQQAPSLDKEQNRRIDYLYELIDALLDANLPINKTDEYRDKETIGVGGTIYQHIEAWHEILSSGKLFNAEPKIIESRWKRIEHGMMFLHDLLYFSLPESAKYCLDESSIAIPPHLLFSQILNSSTTFYNSTRECGGWERISCILLVLTYGLEYLLHDIKEKIKKASLIRWKRVQSLVKESTRRIYSIFTSLDCASRDENGDISLAIDHKKASIIFVMTQYLFPTLHQIISIHPQPTDIAIDSVGLLSSSFSISSKIIQEFENLLCEWMVKFTLLSPETNLLSLENILYHPLRSQAVALFDQKRKLQRKSQTLYQQEAGIEFSDDETYDEEKVLYAKNDLLNKLAAITDAECNLHIPWNEKGVAIFASIFLDYQGNTMESSSEVMLHFPAVYSPSYTFKMFFPHACALFVQVSTSTGISYLQSLLKLTSTPSQISSIPISNLVNTCQLLLNTQKQEGIKLLQVILTKCIHKSKSIQSIDKLVNDCPYPSAIPILLDQLRFFISNWNETTNNKPIIRIIEPFILEMKAYIGGHEHILQMYEIYACSLNLILRILIFHRISDMQRKTLLEQRRNEFNQIKKFWTIAKKFMQQINDDLSKFEEDKFRMFLLLDALEQFINEGNMHFLNN